MWQAEALSLAGRRDRRVACQRAVSGGCISDTSVWILDNGERIFAKVESIQRFAMLAAEADGLRAIAATDSVRVPEVLAVGTDATTGRAFLLTQFIETERPPAGFQERFGQQLARLHSCDVPRPEFGWPDDNFIGSTLQPNGWRQSWTDFFSQQRLRYQWELLEKQGLQTSSLRKSVPKIIQQLPELLSKTNPQPALIHGDLWSGNYLCDTQGQPVLIDPACYQADREAEFGMLLFLGGCGADFFTAYHQTYPLQPQWQQRASVYQLYHLLNHANLFGAGYLNQSEQMAKRVLAGP